MKTLPTQTAAELDALLPSILDRAFRGELEGQGSGTSNFNLRRDSTHELVERSSAKIEV
jgi:hypothetical protein